MISVIARLTIQEDKVESTIADFKQLMQEVAKEEGTLLYTLNRDPKDPNTLVVIERYKDKQALGAHSATEHFKAFSAKLGEVLAAKPDIAVLDELEAIVK